MATVRITGIDVATGKERRVQAGDLIENFGGIVAGMVFRGAIPDVGSFPAEVGREVGDMYTVTSGAAITDPEGTGQTLQPGDEIVWDGTQWAVIGNASLPNVEAALLSVLAADEDLLIRIGGALGALNVGAIGNTLQVIDGGGGSPQVAWGAAPGGGAPSEVVDFTASTTGNVDVSSAVNKIAMVKGDNPDPGGPPQYVLPDPDTLSVGDEIHIRQEIPMGTMRMWYLPIRVVLAAGSTGLLEGIPVTLPGPAFPFHHLNYDHWNGYYGGFTFRVTEPTGGGVKNWLLVSHWHGEYENESS